MYYFSEKSRYYSPEQRRFIHEKKTQVEDICDGLLAVRSVRSIVEVPFSHTPDFLCVVALRVTSSPRRISTLKLAIEVRSSQWRTAAPPVAEKLLDCVVFHTLFSRYPCGGHLMDLRLQLPPRVLGVVYRLGRKHVAEIADKNSIMGTSTYKKNPGHYLTFLREGTT